MLYEKLDFDGEEGRLVLPKGSKKNDKSFNQETLSEVSAQKSHQLLQN